MTTVRECDYPWTGFMIWANGSACCCCYGSSPVGDVTKASPEAVWNNPTMESLRDSLAAGVVHTVCHSGICKFVVGSRKSEESPTTASVPADFDEEWYVSQYFDVRDGIGRGRWSSGGDHYRQFGHQEFRCWNVAEWNRRSHAKHDQASRIGTGYSASLNWLRAPSVGENAIVVSFSATNSGSIAWQPKGGSTPIQASAESYRRLEDFRRVMPMYAYRGDLSGSVEPGDSIALEMQVPVRDLPIGRSFVVLDLVCDEKAVRLSGAAAKPLVVGIHRDGLTDVVRVVTS